jgi:hypothetical protein
VSSQYGARDETCPVSTGGRGGGGSTRGCARSAPRSAPRRGAAAAWGVGAVQGRRGGSEAGLGAPGRFGGGPGGGGSRWQTSRCARGRGTAPRCRPATPERRARRARSARRREGRAGAPRGRGGAAAQWLQALSRAASGPASGLGAGAAHRLAAALAVIAALRRVLDALRGTALDHDASLSSAKMAPTSTRVRRD